VHAATRHREGQQPSTLDYVFTDEENLIEDVKIGSPLGKSDHTVMEWDVTLKVSETESKLTKRNFWKGDYNEITRGLLADNWDEEFAGNASKKCGPLLS